MLAKTGVVIDMTVKEAYEIIKKENPGMKAIQCFDFADFYAFALAEESWNGELLGGAYTTVNKTTGKFGVLFPYEDFEEAKEIPIDTLN